MPRPTKRTFRRLLRLARALCDGAPRTAACGAAGIGETTLRDWIAADEHLAAAIERWEARGEAALVRVVQRAACDDPAQARWLLAVRRPAVYSTAGQVAAVNRPPAHEAVITSAEFQRACAAYVDATLDAASPAALARHLPGAGADLLQQISTAILSEMDARMAAIERAPAPV